MGQAVGVLAHGLFPDGVLVGEGPGEHDSAVAHTRELLADPSVPAIFEGAFEFGGVRIRADLLERLDEESWGLREVKAAARLKGSYLEDIALQVFVLNGCGMDVRSAELVHVNTDFELGDDGVAWSEFFARADVTEAVEALQPAVVERVGQLLEVLAGPDPDVEPSLHCRGRRVCEFWDHCTHKKDADWILRLPRVTRKQFEFFQESGIERISDVPGDFALHASQRNVCEAHRRGRELVSHGLDEALRSSGPPAAYLDFETAGPAVPLYPGTRPFQSLPFQWSLHREDADGALTHSEFLALGDVDPRRAFAESLVDAMDGGTEPILVYSAFESRVLENLGAAFADLRDALLAIRARLFDLLPVVRNCVYHVGFGGSFSIKNVAPALTPGFGYDDLDGVAEGGSAAAAFQRIAADPSSTTGVADLRAQLLAYCARDTLALVHVHRALRRCAAAA